MSATIWEQLAVATPINRMAALRTDINTCLKVLSERLRDMESRLEQATASARK